MKKTHFEGGWQSIMLVFVLISSSSQQCNKQSNTEYKSNEAIKTA